MLTGEPNDQEFEDLAIFVVGEVTAEKKAILAKRALRLLNQEAVEFCLDTYARLRQKIRTVGFPSVSKEIHYEDRVAVTQPRGFHATFEGDSNLKNRFKVNEISWKEGDLGGFSGAPILALVPDLHNHVHAVPIGVLVTGSSQRAQFLSINVATDLIATYLRKKYRLDTDAR
jgi:hypothetical protein